MAIIQKLVCDGHLQLDPQEEVEGYTLPPLMTIHGMRVIDLCNDCQKTAPYALVIDLATEFGREVETRTSKASAGAIPEHLRSQCRFCSRNDFKSQGRKMHERRSHPEELAALEAQERGTEPGDLVGEGLTYGTAQENADGYHCEACDRIFDNASGLNGHKQSKAHKDNVAALVS